MSTGRLSTLSTGMVYATTLHSPSQGGEPLSWNEAEIKRMPGVVAVIEIKLRVALVAESFEEAMAARSALRVQWKHGKAAGFDSAKALAG
jgi:isoquinoline 1-oxidoreductase beta subunit